MIPIAMPASLQRREALAHAVARRDGGAPPALVEALEQHVLGDVVAELARMSARRVADEELLVALQQSW